MIRATPHNGFPSIIVNSDIQSDIEDVMTQMGYGCTEYTLEMVECATDGDLDACDVLDNFIRDIQELRNRITTKLEPNMATCEKCWRDAKGDFDEYQRILELRKDHPCTPAEQCGDMHVILPNQDGSKRCWCGKHKGN